MIPGVPRDRDVIRDVDVKASGDLQRIGGRYPSDLTERETGARPVPLIPPGKPGGPGLDEDPGVHDGRRPRQERPRRQRQVPVPVPVPAGSKR